MGSNRRQFVFGASAVAGSLVAPRFANTAGADEAPLLFATGYPPQFSLVTEVLVPWAQQINERGKGIVKLDVRHGSTLANVVNFYDRVKSDAIQVGWGIQAYVAGKFPASQAPALPFSTDNAEEASAAYWRLIKSGAIENEYSDLEPLFSCVFAQSRLHLRRPVDRIENLSGLKIGSATPVIAELLGRLGASPISIPINQYYESLQRGTVDGVVTPWSAFAPFKLQEVTNYHVELPFGAGVGVVLMSKNKFESLPTSARKVLLDNSGEHQSRRFGAFWNSEQHQGHASVKAAAKHTIVEPDPKEIARLHEIFEPIKRKWAESTPNGVKALATYETILAEIRSGK